MHVFLKRETHDLLGWKSKCGFLFSDVCQKRSGSSQTLYAYLTDNSRLMLGELSNPTATMYELLLSNASKATHLVRMAMKPMAPMHAMSVRQATRIGFIGPRLTLLAMISSYPYSFSGFSQLAV